MEIIEGIDDERSTKSFCGIDIFTWADWDEVYTGCLQFYNVIFCMSSMEKYNGSTVTRNLEGVLSIYSENGEIIWSDYIIAIPEVLKELKSR